MGWEIKSLYSITLRMRHFGYGHHKQLFARAFTQHSMQHARTFYHLPASHNCKLKIGLLFATKRFQEKSGLSKKQIQPK